MEASAAAWGGGSPLRSGGSWSPPPYTQLALYLAANALTIVIGLLIWNLNTVSVEDAGR